MGTRAPGDRGPSYLGAVPMSTAIQRSGPGSGDARSRTYRPAGQRPRCVAGNGRTNSTTLAGAVDGGAASPPAGPPSGRTSRSDSATRVDTAVVAPPAFCRHAATILLALLRAPGRAAGAHAPMPATSDSPSQRTGIEGSPGPPASTGVIAVNVRTVQRRKLPRVTSSHPDEPQSTCPGARGAGLAATLAPGQVDCG